jgi:hypothetical protein
MAAPVQIWTSDWRSIIRSRVRPHGAETFADFAQRHPQIPYVKLARLLGAGVVAAQLEMMQFEEAKAGGFLREAAKDALCRTIHRHIKRGWRVGIHSQRATAGAYAEWLTLIEFEASCPDLVSTAKAAWGALEALEPPSGWLPSGAADPLILAAFDKGWPPSTQLKP